MQEIQNLKFSEFAALYCERQQCEPDELRQRLNRQRRYVLEAEDDEEDSCLGFDDLDYMKSEVYDIAVDHNERMAEADRIADITEEERQVAEVYP